MDIHVSNLGDNSDGSSWQAAFHTIQRGLAAVPDDGGGHRVIVRPDRYVEANLYPAQKGAPGEYNELVGDHDGSLGSGAAGWVVIDSGDPAKGFKSYDWWSTIRAYSRGWSAEHTAETFSAIGWDRWALRRLYATGGDAGIMFDGTDHVEPFSVLVEDCVSIGRAFGGGVASVLSRTGEPMVYRRCHLWALDWWGDTAGAYVRVENLAMPDRPDIVFEDCVMVGPQCSLKGGNYSFTTFMWVAAKRCRLITLNFSQPQGTPTDGIVQSVQHGKYLKVSFEDSTLMGYKLFGAKVEKGTEGEIQYETKGSCLAYVQFSQDVPSGFHRLGGWPVDAFQHLVPPSSERPSPLGPPELVRRDMCELSPLIWRGRLCHMDCVRTVRAGTSVPMCLLLTDATTGEELARFADGYSLASVIAHEGVLHAFASRNEGESWNDVTHFWSSDLRTWEQRVVVEQEPPEHLFNTSVCAGPDGFVMAYETSDPAYPPFTIKFATSADLQAWIKMPGAVFGTDRYAACPCLRYVDGWYYMLYLEHRSPLHCFQTYVTRSRDLRRWWTSPRNPVLRVQGLDEGVNASDPELVELGGRTWVYYAVGDQLTWMNIKRAAYPGTLAQLFRFWYPDDGIEDRGTLAYPLG